MRNVPGKHWHPAPKAPSPRRPPRWDQRAAGRIGIPHYWANPGVQLVLGPRLSRLCTATTHRGHRALSHCRQLSAHCPARFPALLPQLPQALWAARGPWLEPTPRRTPPGVGTSFGGWRPEPRCPGLIHLHIPCAGQRIQPRVLPQTRAYSSLRASELHSVPLHCGHVHVTHGHYCYR